MSPDQTTDNPQISKSHDMAAFSYVWIMAIFVLIFRRDDDFAQFHARQASVLFFISLFVWMIPAVGNLLEVLVAALMIFGFIQASQGHKYSFPIIGDLISGTLDFDKIRAKFSEQRNPSPDSDSKPEPKVENKKPESSESKAKHRKEIADSLITPNTPKS